MAEQAFALIGREAVFSATRHTLQFGPASRQKRTVALVVDGSIKRKHVINLDNARDRAEFVKPLNGIADVVDAELIALSEALAPATEDDDEEQSGRSQASTMVALVKAAGVQLFHDENKDAFATVPVESHLETWPIKSKGFRAFVAFSYYQTHGTAPGGQATQDALNVIAGEAIFTGPEHKVWTRIAFADEAIYLDLADDEWRAIEITAAGWRILESKDVPVKFRRPSGMLPLPEPVRGGTLHDLRLFLGFDEDSEELVLVEGWLLGVFLRQGGRPLLELTGEQGSGKSTKAHMLSNVVDPCTVALRRPPREEGDLLIAAKNRLIVAYDNLSKIEDWLSDAFCRLSTGGGLGKRELYTDTEEVLLNAQRPAILTGINAVVQNSDLLDRTVRVSLQSISDEDRETESDVWSVFDELHASVLGGLLDAVAVGLRELPNTRLTRRPRMADFAEWVEACGSSIGWESGLFLETFEKNRGGANMIAIEALPVGTVILDLMAKQEKWAGTATELLDALGAMVTDALKRERDWPKRANTLARQLKRLSPNLAKVGVWVGFDRSARSRVNTITLERNDLWRDDAYAPHKKEASESSLASLAEADRTEKSPETRSFLASDPHGRLSLADRSQALDSSLAPTCLDCGDQISPGLGDRCPICEEAWTAAQEGGD